MPRPSIEFDADLHLYKVDGVPVPSVTTVIKATVPVPFAAGAWWGWDLGIRAAHEVYKPSHWRNTPHDAEALKEACKQTDLRPDSKRDTAADRGTAFHEALQAWAELASPLSADDFEEDDAKVVRGLAKWLTENEPEFLYSEQITASKIYGYAGTLDAFVQFHAGEYKGQTARLDWKTSKSVYPDQHFPQLAAYEEAEVECGEDPSDFQAVVHIPASGRIKMKVSNYTFDDFRVLLRHYQQMQFRNGT